MNNKKEINKSIKLKAYAIAYITLIPFGLYNAALCRLVYGFFGFNSKFIISFLVTILIVVAIIFLSIRNMEKKYKSLKNYRICNSNGVSCNNINCSSFFII